MSNIAFKHIINIIIILCVIIFLIIIYNNNFDIVEKMSDTTSNNPLQENNIMLNSSSQINIPGFENSRHVFNTNNNAKSSMESSNFKSNFCDKKNKINLKCTINGINYYLANVNNKLNTSKYSNDCTSSALVLIPVEEIELGLKQYLDTLDTNKKICNYTDQQKCLKNSTNCSEDNYSCEYERFYNHDFRIKHVGISTDGSNKYILTGYNMPHILFDTTNTNIGLEPTILNQSLYDSPGNGGDSTVSWNKTTKPLLNVCSDYFNFGIPRFNKNLAEIYVSETLNINDNSKINIKLAFKTQVLLHNIDAKTGVNKYVQCPGCKPNSGYSYLGISMTANNLYTTKDGKQYQRISYIPYSSSLITGNYILSFEPILVE